MEGYCKDEKTNLKNKKYFESLSLCCLTSHLCYMLPSKKVFICISFGIDSEYTWGMVLLL